MSKKNRNDRANSRDNGIDPKAAYTQVRFKPRTEKQKQALEEIRGNHLNFLIGAAGTAKTILLCVIGMELFQKGRVGRIVLIRPAVEAGKSLGYLPGTQEEKMYPYLLPIYDNLEKIADKYVLDSMIQQEQIEILSPTLARGRTLDNCFVIVDEAQNLTKEQLRMILTRAGEGTYYGVTMDGAQIDIKSENSCFNDLEIFRGIEGIGFVEFTNEDIVRSPLAKLVMDVYDNARKNGGVE
jgi:phosphate starvation-inducible PhoH-like protein